MYQRNRFVKITNSFFFNKTTQNNMIEKALPKLNRRGSRSDEPSAEVLAKVKGCQKSQTLPVMSTHRITPSVSYLSPPPLPKKKSLMLYTHRSSSAGSKTQLHLSPIYYRPFFTYAVDILLKMRIYISPYTCVSKTMSENYHRESVQRNCVAVLYFVAQPITMNFIKRMPTLPQMQVLSHFPRSEIICDKVNLAVLVNILKKEEMRQEETNNIWNFIPATCTTAEEFAVESQKPCNISRPWVMKDDRGCQGRGIRISCQPDPFLIFPNNIIQRYIEPPMLIQGKRFDIRVYVMVSSFSPLRVFYGTEGLVHLCVDKYQTIVNDESIGPLTRHVSNTFVNSRVSGYDRGNKTGTSGNSRSFASLNAAIAECPNATEFTAPNLWTEIKRIILKTILAVKPFIDDAMEDAYRSRGSSRVRCFELYGYDISVADDFTPYLLEVNQFPSWQVNGSWYMNVKSRLLREMFKLAEVLNKYPTPDSPPDNTTQSQLTAIEDAALAEAQASVDGDSNALLERIWPSSSWSPKDLTDFDIAHSIAEQFAVSVMSDFDPSKTVSLFKSAQSNPPSPSDVDVCDSSTPEKAAAEGAVVDILKQSDNVITPRNVN